MPIGVDCWWCIRDEPDLEAVWGLQEEEDMDDEDEEEAGDVAVGAQGDGSEGAVR